MAPNTTLREEIMSAVAVNELREFHRFLSEKVTAAATTLSPEEALDEWRRLHPSTEAIEEDAAAIQEALNDMNKGDKGIPFDDFDREFRARRNIPA
jgi:hypothetical protein